MIPPEYFRSIRARTGLAPAEFGRYMGFADRQMIDFFEKGTREPTGPVLVSYRMLAAMQLTYRIMLAGDNMKAFDTLVDAMPHSTLD